MSLSSPKPFSHFSHLAMWTCTSFSSRSNLIKDPCLKKKGSIMLTYKVSGWVTTSQPRQLQPRCGTCKGQCLPLCIKATQTLLQHPGSLCGICQFVEGVCGIWVFEHNSVDPDVGRNVSFACRQLINNKMCCFLTQKTTEESLRKRKACFCSVSEQLHYGSFFFRRQATMRLFLSLSQLDPQCTTSLTCSC